MLVNNLPYKLSELNLQFSLNSFSLTRQQTVKYLRVYIDDNLKWSTQTHHLSLQLARYSGIFCRVRNLLPFEISRMLYYCFTSSRTQYGIVI